MRKKWITITIVAIVAYFVWRRFGGAIKDAISSATK